MTESVIDWLNDRSNRDLDLKIYLAVQETTTDASPLVIISRTKAIFISVGDDSPLEESVLIEAIKEYPEDLYNHTLSAQWSVVTLEILREEERPLVAFFPVTRISAQDRVEFLSELASGTTETTFGFSNRCMLVNATAGFFFWAEDVISSTCAHIGLPIEPLSLSNGLPDCKRSGSWYLDLDYLDQALSGKLMTQILHAHSVIYPELSAYVFERVPESENISPRPLPEIFSYCDWEFSRLPYHLGDQNERYVRYPVYRQHSPPERHELRDYLSLLLLPEVVEEWQEVQPEESTDSDSEE